MERASARQKWSAFWVTVKQFESQKMNPWMGFRNAIGVALPLAAGIAIGQPVAGALMSTGALNVCFSDAGDPYGQRARRMLAACFLCAFSIAVGAFSGNSTLAAVVLTAIWGFIAGMMVAVGTTQTDLGTVSLVSLVVFHARPMKLEDACLAGLAALAGGLLQTGFALLLWPVQRYALEQRELGKLYRELAAIPNAPVDGLDAPRASAQITAAREALSVIARQHSLESDRCVSLLNQAERIRLSLLTLARLKARLERDESGRPSALVVEDVLGSAARVLLRISAILSGGEAAQDAAPLSHMEILSNKLRNERESAEHAFLAAVFDSARFQTDALSGQLRAAVQLAGYGTELGAAEVIRVESAKPRRLRLAGGLAVLRSNMNFESAAFRHAIRLATCVALGEAFGRSLSWQRTYWLPMTVAIVLKPDFTATFSRGILRTAGTIAGLFFATLLFHLTARIAAEIFLVAALTFILRWAGPANYGILTAAVSALVVVLIAVSGVDPKDVIWARGVNSLAGGALALLAYILWPTWQRMQIREVVATMLDAYREYFRQVSRVYLHPGLRDEDGLNASRSAARLTRSNVEASIDRMSVEPGVTPEMMAAWSAMLASSHGLINAVMALEAALPESGDGPPPDGFRAFCHDVEISLHSVGAALRGSKILARALPDLREGYTRMIQAGDFSSGRMALMAMETDRLTNRLNTLAEQVVKWISAHPVPITLRWRA